MLMNIKTISTYSGSPYMKFFLRKSSIFCWPKLENFPWKYILLSQLWGFILEEIMSIATTCSCPMQGNGCSNYPMQPKVKANPHGIRACINLMLIALHCIRVGCKVLNNAKGQHVSEVHGAYFLYPHRWKLPLHKIRTKIQRGGLFPFNDDGQLDYHHGRP